MLTGSLSLVLGLDNDYQSYFSQRPGYVKFNEINVECRLFVQRGIWNLF